jgi:hypothetical protein
MVKLRSLSVLLSRNTPRASPAKVGIATVQPTRPNVPMKAQMLSLGPSRERIRRSDLAETTLRSVSARSRSSSTLEKASSSSLSSEDGIAIQVQ